MFALLSSLDETVPVVLCADCCRRRTNTGTKCSPGVLTWKAVEQRICHILSKTYVAGKRPRPCSIEIPSKIFCLCLPDTRYAKSVRFTRTSPGNLKISRVSTCQYWPIGQYWLSPE